ncbi:tetratricopeptide repeat protein [Gloeocapsopsis sp. IPPAS B-1203]|uniref:tetratricopeptide repeat protein n=1 Tax=Gloeocapsopsis sp. IPPAS B-1203 TaxID=2049454 RepID=UPI0025A0B4D8|nr:tetratricopeptide repeat protein [Gloeocapsopsis sp. IPPAS B-1203]
MSQPQKSVNKMETGKRQISYLVPFVLMMGLIGTPVLEVVMRVPVAQAQALPNEVRRGYTLLEQGRVKDAIAAFQQAVRRYPQSIPAKLGLAIAYRRQGEISEAWDTYQQVLAQEPNNQLALQSVGALGSFRPEWQARGIEALTTLLSLNPNDTEARAQRALLYGYQGRFAEALADYQIVLANNPSSEILLGAAETYTNSGNYQQGLELFNRYRATGQSISGYAAIAYARALRQTGNVAAAIQVLEPQVQAAQIDGAIQARAELSLAYLANQQFTEALAILDPLQGRVDAILPLARSLNEIRLRANVAGLAERVSNLYTQALAQAVTPDPQLLREAADVFSGLPQGQQTALQLYRQLATSQPNDLSVQVQLLALERQLGLISPADLKGRLSQVLQILPTDPTQQQQLAQALAQIEPPGPEFLPVYQNLLLAGVNQPFLNFRIAQLLLQSNDLEGAKRALAAYAATPAGATDLAPQLLAAEIERREGNLTAAQARYQALIAANIQDGDVLNAALQGLAGIYLSQNQPDNALILYDQLLARNPQDANIQLGRASIAYQANRISEAQADAVLSSWLQTQPTTNAPAELFSLVAALPANPQRESLYNALLAIDPNNIPVQTRSLQLIASRDPALARARVAQIVASNPNNVGVYFLQGQLAQAIGDLSLADRAYQTILSAQPYNADALSALGGIRFQQRRFNSAEQLYSQVLAVNPNDLSIRRTLASLSAAQDKPLTALEQLERLQVNQPNGQSDSDLSRQRQQLQEDFLRRRGFQPSWERY